MWAILISIALLITIFLFVFKDTNYHPVGSIALGIIFGGLFGIGISTILIPAKIELVKTYSYTLYQIVSNMFIKDLE